MLVEVYIFDLSSIFNLQASRRTVSHSIITSIWYYRNKSYEKQVYNFLQL